MSPRRASALPAAPGTSDLATLRAVWDAVADALALSDPDGKILAINRAYCVLYGFRPAELIGNSFALIFPEEARAEAEAVYRRVFACGDVSVHESRVRSADGADLVVEARISYIERQGERVAMLSTIRDLTAQRRAEAERDAFVASVSHDLQQPLALMKGRAELLLRQQARGAIEAERLTHSLRSMCEAADRMGEQLVAVLDAARLQSGQPLDLEPRSADLLGVVREVVAEYAATTDAHTLVCSSSETALEGQFDVPRLRRAVGNLLSNAIKYSPRGGQVSVRVSLADHGEPVAGVVEVQDTGIGIPNADLPRLFERFHRGANVMGLITGTGLGLAGARQVAEQHGGSIEVQTVEGQGSTFRLRLPLDGSGIQR